VPINMLFTCFALVCLIQSLLAVELSIYKSFTQVRQTHSGVGNYGYDFTTADFGNVIDGSISWDGTPFARQEVYSTLESLQDATVTVRRSSSCECETIEAKIVNPTEMLLQNLKTGAYFYADKQSIEYTSTRPNNGGTTLSFEFNSETTEHNGTLSYLMKGITWKPSYDFILLGNNECKLRAYANIENSQQREYTVENTYLLGGDIQLATTASFDAPSRELSISHMSMKPMRPIQDAGEHNGLYSYALQDKYTLRPSSSIRLPFLDIAAKYRFYYNTIAGISTGQVQGVFQKNYDLTPDHFMPAGIITIRDKTVLVGQSNLPDVPENYTQTITVGSDNDVRYLIKGNLTAKTDDNATVSFETYELDVQVVNFKHTDVNGQLIFRGGVQVTLIDTNCKSVTVNGNELNLPIQLAQGENRQCKIIAKVRLN